MYGFYFLNKSYLKQINKMGFLTLVPVVPYVWFRVPRMGAAPRVPGPTFPVCLCRETIEN